MDFEPDDENEEVQQAILDGLAALEGCEAFDIEGLPEPGPLGEFNEWLMGLDTTRASSPIQPSPLPSPPLVMLYAGNGMYHAVPADYVQWEGRRWRSPRRN